jgi:hypothetical protein
MKMKVLSATGCRWLGYRRWAPTPARWFGDAPEDDSEIAFADDIARMIHGG